MAQAKFLHGSLMRHVTVMSSTASIGLVALFLVDLIDMVFISMLGQAELAAAIGYAGSILFGTTSVGIGFSIATGALVARSLGSGRPDRARRFASHVLAVAFLVSCLIAALVWIATPALMTFLRATGETHEYAVSYLRILVPSMPVIVLGMCTGAILRGHGDAGRAMMTTLAGGAVNLILDPIFIFSFGWGLEGAAWASVIARFAVLGVGLYFVFRYRGGLFPPQLARVLRDLSRMSALAVPAILTNIATPAGQIIVTRAMASYGDDAVAGMSIIGRLTPVAFGVVFALSGAVGPIVGQNFGARAYDRVRGALTASVQFCAAYVLAVSLALFLLRAPIADLFSASGDARTLIFLFCGPLALLYFFNGLLFCANASFNNLNRPFWSTILNWGRNTIGMALPVMIFAHWYGAEGVLIGQALGGIVFGLLGIWLAYRLTDDYASGKIAPGKPRQSVSWWRALAPFGGSGRR